MKITTVLVAFLLPVLSLAQNQPESQTAVQKNVVYNLAVKPESMFVTEDCEGGEGNQGEWVYQISLAAPGLSDARTGTRNYPSREGIVSWSDQTNYRLYDANVELRGIAAQNLGSVEIKLQATEWDPDSADPTMDDLAATQTIELSEQTQKGTVELNGGRCVITLSYSASWAETRLPGVYEPLGNRSL